MKYRKISLKRSDISANARLSGSRPGSLRNRPAPADLGVIRDATAVVGQAYPANAPARISTGFDRPIGPTTEPGRPVMNTGAYRAGGARVR